MKEKMSKASGKESVAHSSVRVSITSKKRADSLLLAINKKKLGRKVKFDDLFDLAIELVTDEHCKMLQERSLTHEDRKEILRQKYIAARGAISKDEFTGFMMTAAFPEFLKELDSSSNASPRVAEVAARAG